MFIAQAVMHIKHPMLALAAVNLVVAECRLLLNRSIRSNCTEAVIVQKLVRHKHIIHAQ